MAIRRSLRISQHGKIARGDLGNGVWLVRCRIRDTDGVTRRIQRIGPADQYDKHGQFAEDALIEALADRGSAQASNVIGMQTLVTTLVGADIAQLAEDGRGVRILDAYRNDAGELGKFVGGVRVGEPLPARVDVALRSLCAAPGITMARRSRTLLRGAHPLAVREVVRCSRSVRVVKSIHSRPVPQSATALTRDQLRDLLTRPRVSEGSRLGLGDVARYTHGTDDGR